MTGPSSVEYGDEACAAQTRGREDPLALTISGSDTWTAAKGPAHGGLRGHAAPGSATPHTLSRTLRLSCTDSPPHET